MNPYFPYAATQLPSPIVIDVTFYSDMGHLDCNKNTMPRDIWKIVFDKYIESYLVYHGDYPILAKHYCCKDKYMKFSNPN